jgi:hypothetical protein
VHVGERTITQWLHVEAVPTRGGVVLRVTAGSPPPVSSEVN